MQENETTSSETKTRTTAQKWSRRQSLIEKRKEIESEIEAISQELKSELEGQ